MTSATPAVKVPDFPEELTASTRRAARSISATVTAGLDMMREVLPIILSGREGEERITNALDTVDTPECNEYRARRDEMDAANTAADAEYLAAIAPFMAARDKVKADNAAALSPIEESARVSVASVIGDIPSQAEVTEAVQDWTAAVKQLRDAQRNSKTQLNLEWSIDIPSLPGTKVSGATGSDDPLAWRPRFNGVSINGTALPIDTTTGDICTEIGVSRTVFMTVLNRQLGGNDVAQRQWDAMSPGETLQIKVGPVNATATDPGKTYDVTVVKAEPIKRGKTATPDSKGEAPAAS